MSEYQGVEYRHLLRKWNFTTLIKSIVKLASFKANSVNLFPFQECFVNEQSARPSSGSRGTAADAPPQWRRDGRG